MNKYLNEDEINMIKESDNLLFKALEIVSIMFENDTDKGGYPYYIHLMKVYKSVSCYDEKIVALLHDIIEDKKISENELLDLGFPKNIVEDVKILTKNKKDEYSEYIKRIIDSNSVVAMEVKLADLKHNLDLSRIKNPTSSDFERINNKYKPAYEKIVNKLNEMER